MGGQFISSIGANPTAPDKHFIIKTVTFFNYYQEENR